jgi:lipoyl-dependent peroxiredoxin
MNKTLYTARAQVTGGRSGHGRSSDGALDVQLRPPVELGGGGGGTNPEQLFAVAYAACFDGALGSVARRSDTDLGEVTIDSAVSLLAVGARKYQIAVELVIEISALSSELAVRLVREAHEVCPYSHATRGNVEVTLLVNGLRA